MIKLKGKSGTAVYINPDHLVDIGTLKEGMTYVSTTISGDGFYEVAEKPEEVARKVLEYKLAMEDYRQSAGEYRTLARYSLDELAGLEESQ